MRKPITKLLTPALIMLAACTSDRRDTTNPLVDEVQFNVNAQINAITDAPVVAFDNEVQRVAPGTDRNINWDGAAVTVLTNGMTATFPPTLFRDGAGDRQIIIGGITGENVMVSEDSFATMPGGGVNPSAGGGFAPLTGTVNFAVSGSNSATVSFTRADITKAGLVNGFGVVFTDVEVEGRSGLRFFDAEGNLLRDVRCPAGPSGAHTFIGAVFESPVVAMVKIDMGDNMNFGNGPENPSGGDDYVVVDDFRFFLSSVSVPATEFVAPVTAITDNVVSRFNDRVLPLALGQERAINWDGAAVTVLTNGMTAAFPPTLFRDGAGDRQIIIGGVTGENVMVSEDSFATNSSGGPNASAGGGFGPLTGTVNFAVSGSNSATVQFTLADRTTAATVHGFGAIFTDVEVVGRSGLRFFDREGRLLRTVRAVPMGSGEHQFVGAIFDSPIVASVSVDMGNNARFGLGPESPQTGGDDFVVVDDFRFFMSQSAVPTTDFIATVTSINDDVLTRFDARRLPLALGQEQNINWDGGAVTALTQGMTSTIAPDLFLNGAGNRQLTIGDNGQNIVVSEDAFATLPGGGANPSAGGGFANLTPTVNFSVTGGNVITIRFFEPNTTTPASIHGFGAIFTDVEVSNIAGLRIFDSSDTLIRTVSCPAGMSGASQFIGTMFASPMIRRIEIDMGNNMNFGTNPENPSMGNDFIILDDFRFFKAPATQVTTR